MRKPIKIFVRLTRKRLVHSERLGSFVTAPGLKVGREIRNND